jgi:hypothetical protein
MTRSPFINGAVSVIMLDTFLILVCLLCILNLLILQMNLFLNNLLIDSDWNNVARQQTVCDAYLESTSNVTDFPIQDQFSVMISTYNPERIEHLSLIIRHLLKSTKVHTVFVTWHNPALEVPTSLYNDLNEKDLARVKVLGQTFDSLNNRFNPTQELKTDAVYIMDDDIFLDLKDLEFTFSVGVPLFMEISPISNFYQII